MTIKIRQNQDGTFRVVHWVPSLFNLLNRKIIKHFKSIEDAKEYVKSLPDHSRLDIDPKLIGLF